MATVCLHLLCLLASSTLCLLVVQLAMATVCLHLLCLLASSTLCLLVAIVGAVERCDSGDEQMTATKKEWSMYGKCVSYNTSSLMNFPCDDLYVQNVDHVFISFNRTSENLEEYIENFDNFLNFELYLRRFPEICRNEILTVSCHYFLLPCGNSSVFEPPTSICEDTCNYVRSLCPEEVREIVQIAESELPELVRLGLTAINCSNTEEYLGPLPHCCQDLGIEIPPPTSDTTSVRVAVGTSMAVVGVVIIAIIISVVVVVIRKHKIQKEVTTKDILLHERSASLDSTRYYGNTNPLVLSLESPPLLRVSSGYIQKMTEERLLIPGRNLSLMDTVGQGEFGVVYRGYLTGWRAAQGQSLVAVKTLKGLFSTNEVDNIIMESLKMVKFNHPNVMKLIGVCIEKGQSACLVMPYMAYGSLLSYLKKNRAELTIANHDNIELVTTAQKKLLSICLQIAKGMEYLASKQFVHRDLAARNCMIDEHFVIKVGDFGLSEDIYTRNYFRQGTPVKLPLRWMAVESLNDGLFTEKTDVWSFGVTVWEVFSLGKIPYPGVDPFTLIKYLDTGGRLDKPANAACSEEIYAVVTKCWEGIPDNRPKFSELVITFSSCLEGIAGYIDFSPDPLTKEPPVPRYDPLTPTQQQDGAVDTEDDHLNLS